MPFLIHPDTDFQCIDASATTPESWLELPLRPDRPIPVRCAVGTRSRVILNPSNTHHVLQITLPTSVAFTRSSSIPYFVVFTTTPRSSELAKEIAADATVSVSLIRQVIVTEHNPSLPPTPPLTPSSDESDSFSRPKLLRRVAKSHSRLTMPRRTSEGAISYPQDKPLPEIPTISQSFSDTRTIHHDMCIGFPKRPRQQFDKEGHPSLETIANLPDGLHKTRIHLNKDMLPSIDWAGISVKVCSLLSTCGRSTNMFPWQYYLDISVLLGQDDLHARIPVRIL